MNVVMNMLPGDHWGDGMGFLGGCVSTGVLKLQTLLFKPRLYSLGITMYMFTSFYPHDIVTMLFRENFTILDRLNCGMIVILMDLAVNSCGGFFVALFNDSLVYDSWSNCFMYSRVVMTGLVPNT